MKKNGLFVSTGYYRSCSINTCVHVPFISAAVSRWIWLMNFCDTLFCYRVSEVLIEERISQLYFRDT